eukprot:TRINITY_DN5400_c0_g1_i15.p1 TRINITY_DN5400_c0_g1~~TRINITY_DN5400_c0_g1_i15.p1  ORF type:complete len:674 (-),score=150.29 TRINITY_DN5400_c0_g1_i15:88-2109(-)
MNSQDEDSQMTDGPALPSQPPTQTGSQSEFWQSLIGEDTSLGQHQHTPGLARTNTTSLYFSEDTHAADHVDYMARYKSVIHDPSSQSSQDTGVPHTPFTSLSRGASSLSSQPIFPEMPSIPFPSSSSSSSTTTITPPPPIYMPVPSPMHVQTPPTPPYTPSPSPSPAPSPVPSPLVAVKEEPVSNSLVVRSVNLTLVAREQLPQPLAIPEDPITTNATPMLESIRKFLNDTNAGLEREKANQTSIIAAGCPPDRVQRLERVYQTMMSHIEQAMSNTDKLFRDHYITPSEMEDGKDIRDSLYLALTKADLLNKELSLSSNPATAHQDVAALVVSSQPPPQIVFKGKYIQDSFIVDLVTATKFNCDIISDVVGKMAKTEGSNKKAAADEPQALESNEVPLNEDGRAHFGTVKVNLSTRMTIACLKFNIQVRDKRSGATTILESNSSHGMICITNESQWSDAAGKLVLGEAFEDKDTTPWPRFANALHWHLLLHTSQVPKAEVLYRPLYGWELNYIHTRYFGGAASVRKNQAEAFWQWFGPVLMGLRFKRNILPLWQMGGIYGIITKEECTTALEPYPEGTFLIRFSESVAGAFAIAYATDDPNERVKHFLVKPDDLAANKTLPDFLKDKNQFRTVLQLAPPSRETRPVDKDLMMSNLYSKRKTVQPPAAGGYLFL